MLLAAEDADAERLAGRLEELAREIRKRSEGAAPDIDGGEINAEKLDEAAAKLDKAKLWIAEMTAKLTAFAVDEASGRAGKKEAADVANALLIYAEQAGDDVQAASALLEDAMRRSE